VAQPTLAIASARSFVEADTDAAALGHALGELGLSAETVPWDDPGVDWGRFSLVVVRSTWDYVERRDEFVAWAKRVPTLANGAMVLEWNTDKRYLADLASAGVAVVPTTFLGPGDQLVDPGTPFVVKPSVSAGAQDTVRYRAGDLEVASRHVRSITDGGRTAMVQPYLDSVDLVGESTLIFVGGRFSHAVRRGAMLYDGGRRQPGEQEVAAAVASPAELSAANGVLEAIPEALSGASDLLYARVDLLAGDDDRLLLLELEVTEPFLFLAYDEGAPKRFARAIARHLAVVSR